MVPDVPISMAPAAASRPAPRSEGRTDLSLIARDGADFGSLVDRDGKADDTIEGDAQAPVDATPEEAAEEGDTMPDGGAKASPPAAIEPDWLEALLAEVETVTRPKADTPDTAPAAPLATAAPASATPLPLTVALAKSPTADMERFPRLEGEGETAADPDAGEGPALGPLAPSTSADRHFAGPGTIQDQMRTPGSIPAPIGQVPSTIAQPPAEGDGARLQSAAAQAPVPVPVPAESGAKPTPGSKPDGVAPDPTALRSPNVAAPDPAIAAPAVASVADPSRAMPPLPVPLPRLRAELAREVKALVQQGRAEMETRRQKDGSLTTEMELSPAELGRLRIILHSGERGLHVSVVVDRPESLEAVRRHLEGFHRALMADGVTLDDVDIGAGGRGGDRPDPRSAQRTLRVTPPDDGPAPSLPPRPSNGPPPAGRLDIRL